MSCKRLRFRPRAANVWNFVKNCKRLGTHSETRSKS